MFDSYFVECSSVEHQANTLRYWRPLYPTLRRSLSRHLALFDQDASSLPGGASGVCLCANLRSVREPIHGVRG